MDIGGRTYREGKRIKDLRNKTEVKEKLDFGDMSSGFMVEAIPGALMALERLRLECCDKVHV